MKKLIYITYSTDIKIYLQSEYKDYIKSLSMCYGFQITYFNIQQLSIVLMIALLEHFNLEVNEKVSF